MNNINPKLKEYIENEIFPLYAKNDEGHGIEHIKYVIRRCLEFSSQFQNINIDMLYTIASFHDLAHHIDKDQHEILSAKIFYEDEKIKEFFTEEQRRIMKDAIEDHRSSLEYTPRNDYGKILSSADRTTNLNKSIERTHLYSSKNYPELTLEQKIERAYNYIKKKYGKMGYAPTYCKDTDYEKMNAEVEALLSSKAKFVLKYLQVNNIQDIKIKAKYFAIEAHKDQKRKSEPDKPMIIHPISVAMILEQYGFDDRVIAAGYLHDVVEDTKYTIEDIEKEFGRDIASLVMGASEPDKSLSWEERKQHTIEETKKLPLRNKLVICADKINNVEDLYLKFEKNGQRDFSSFKRGEEKQKWYYTNIYKSLIFNENKDLPIFKRLKAALELVFGKKEDLFLRDKVFCGKEKYYQELKKINAQRQELLQLKKLCSSNPSFVIDFSGAPKYDNSRIIESLYDFFQIANFDIKLIENTSNLENISQIKGIVFTRGLLNELIHCYIQFLNKEISKNTYLEIQRKYLALFKQSIDFHIINYMDPLVLLQKEYLSRIDFGLNSIADFNKINKFNDTLTFFYHQFLEKEKKCSFIDTTFKSTLDTTIELTEQVLPLIRKKYIKEFQKEIE